MPKILVAGDDLSSSTEISQNLCKLLDSDEGWVVIETANESDTLQTLRSESIQLVLNSMDGKTEPHIDMLSLLATDEELKDIPTIAFSRNSSNEQEALRKGAVDFFTMPIGDYKAIAIKVQTHAMRNMQTINLKRASEMVALLKDIDNIQNVMSESLVDFSHQMRAFSAAILTYPKQAPKGWEVYLSHNIPSNITPFIERFKSTQPETLKRILQSHIGFCISDAQNDAITSDSMDPVITRLNAKSLLVLPLIADKTVIGALVFFFNTKRFFDSTAIESMTKTIPGIVYAIKSAEKIKNIRKSLIGIWQKGAEGLRQLQVFPTDKCKGCEEPCINCSFLSHEGFASIEGVVVFIKCLMDRVIELSSNVDNYNKRLENQVKKRTHQLLLEIDERKKVEQEIKKTGEELEKRVADRTAELVTANEVMTLDLYERKKAEEALRKSEQKYLTLINTIPHGVREQDIDGIITFANAAYCDMVRLPAEMVLGKNILDFIELTDERESIRRYFMRALQEEMLPSTYTTQNISERDTSVYTQVDWDYKRNEEGEITGFISVITEITERKLAEEMAKEAHNRLEVRVKERTQELSEANESLKKQIAERERIEEKLRTAQEELEYRVEERTVELIRANHKMASEISEKIKAEQAVTEAHKETEGLLSAISSIFIGVDENGIITRWNEAATQTFGMNANDLVGKKFKDAKIKWNWDEFNARFPQDRPEQKVFRLENMEYQKQNNETGFLGLTLSRVIPETGGKNGIHGFILLGADRTERKRYQDRLRMADTVYRNTIEGIVITDTDGVIQSVNPAFTSITGHTQKEAIGNNIHDILKSDRHPSEFYKELWTSLDKNGFWNGEIWNRHKNSVVYPQMLSIVAIKDDDGAVRQFLTVMRDITEIKAAEEELSKRSELLMQSEKLAAIGELASGVAHELNQPLNHINITCQLLVKMLDNNRYQKDSFFDEIMIIVDNVQRAVEIITSMRDFARKDSCEIASIDVCKAIGTAIKMFGTQLKTHDISLNVTPPNKPVMIQGSVNKLGQVIVNMITNARDALRTVQDDRKKLIDIRVSEENEKVRIRVTDNGAGMSQDALKDIFTPFYTTKETGAGTGLGLSISYQIISSFGGNIEVESSKKGKGTTMLITLNASNGSQHE